MRPNEVRDALWMIDVFERWNMPTAEADVGGGGFGADKDSLRSMPIRNP